MERPQSRDARRFRVRLYKFANLFGYLVNYILSLNRQEILELFQDLVQDLLDRLAVLVSLEAARHRRRHLR